MQKFPSITALATLYKFHYVLMKFHLHSTEMFSNFSFGFLFDPWLFIYVCFIFGYLGIFQISFSLISSLILILTENILGLISVI